MKFSDRLKVIIKTNKRCNPFNPEFDYTYLSNRLNRKSDDEKVAIQILRGFSIIYGDALGHSMKVLEKHALTKEQIIDGFFAKGNLFAAITFHETMAALEGGPPVNELERLQYQNVGMEGTAKNTIELLADVLAEILNHSKLGLFDNMPLKSMNDNDEDLNKCLQLVHLYFNVIINIKSALDLLLNAETTFEFNGRVMKISHVDELWETIPAANEIRRASHINELYYPLTLVEALYSDANGIVGLTVENGRIHLKLGITSVSNHDLFHSQVIQDILYPHLSGVQLAPLYNYTIHDVAHILRKITEITSKSLPMGLDNDLKFGDVPFKIFYEDLVNYLVFVTDYSTEFIQKAIKLLTGPSGNATDFWTYPLYEQGDYLYLGVSATYAPNHERLMGIWLKDLEYSADEHLMHFKNHIKVVYTGSTNNEFRPSLFERFELASEKLLVLESRDYLVVLILIHFIPPVTDDAQQSALNTIRETLKRGQERTTALLSDYRHEIKKNILHLGLTTNNIFSGMIVNEVPLVDWILLNNYLETGRQQRVQIISDGNNRQIKELYDRVYYRNRDEFERNMKDFFRNPVPVISLVAKLKLTHNPILPPEASPIIWLQKVDIITHEEEELSQLKDLDTTLRNEYLTGLGLFNDDQRIFQLFTVLFNRFAIGKTYKQQQIDDMFAFIDSSRRVTAAHLVFYLIKQIEILQKVTLFDAPHFEEVEYNIDEASLLLQKIRLSELKLPESLINFEITDELSDEEVRKVLSYLTDFISQMTIKIYSKKELLDFELHLILLRGLIKYQGVADLLYTGLGNYVDVLNLIGEFQWARKIGMVTWKMSIVTDTTIHCWNVLFRTSVRQKNIITAGIWGGILFSALNANIRIQKSLKVDSLYSAGKYFREFGYVEFVSKVVKQAKKLSLSTYDTQKFTLLLFNTRLKNNFLKDKNYALEIIKYLTKNYPAICKYGEKGCVPWIHFLENYIEVENYHERFIHPQVIFFLTRLKDAIDDPDRVIEISQVGNRGTIDIQKELSRILSAIFQTQDFSHFKYEVQNALPFAQKAFIRAIEWQNTELIWPLHYFFNDQRLSFNDPKKESIIRQATLQRYLTYLSQVNKLMPGQLLIWLVLVRKDVFEVTLTPSGDSHISKIDTWDCNKMNTWLQKNMEKFYFNSQGEQYYDYQAQEEKYQEIVNELSPFGLKSSTEFNELLVLTSVSLAGFPSNLITVNGDFVAAKFPVTNVLNLDYFMGNAEPLQIKGASVSAWLPIEGQNDTISWGYAGLEKLIKDKSGEITTSVDVQKPFSSDINIFLAHGTIGVDGFKYIEAVDNEFIYNYDFFGRGAVAILFICNSGSLRENIYSNEVVSLAQELVHNGYKAVVASFWKYDVTMATIWLGEFFKGCEAGFPLSQSTFLANSCVNDYHEETGRMFHDPRGWASMHLYGNPNLKLQI